MNVLFETDADPSLIARRRVAILGYGNQGRPHALNLRDSGVDQIRIASRPGPARDRARSEGFETMAPAQAAAWCDLMAILVPDDVQPELYASEIAPHLPTGAALLFAHGLAIHFSLLVPRDDLDVILVAPKGPGTALRSTYQAGGGLVSLVAVARDASGGARGLGLSYAAGLGSGRAGMIETSFAEECEADLFNEQAVLWGAIPELIQAGFDTLVEAGFAPEVAYLECVGEVKLIADLIHARGLSGMRAAISTTAEFGALKGGTRIITAETRTEMRRILRDVRSGHFTRDLMVEAAAGHPLLKAARDSAAAQPIEAVGARLRRLGSGADEAGPGD